jgi:membrane protease YdiL (CAAX protease family)
MTIASETSLTAAQPECRADGKQLRWFEVLLVLLVACGEPLLSSLYLLKNGPGAMPHISNARWTIGILHEVTALLLVGYVLSRRNLRFRDLGLRWSLRDIGAGLLIALGSFAAYAIGSLLIHSFHSAMFPSAARSLAGKDFFAHPSIAVIPFNLLNPFFEELIVRAYLMTEIRDLTGSSKLAVAISVSVQFSYHLYYGWEGALSLSFIFLIFALYYARTRRALPLIVAHGFFDIYALILLR